MKNYKNKKNTKFIFLMLLLYYSFMIKILTDILLV